MEAQEIAVRLGVAMLFGGLIGFERQWRQRMAGLRTNSLVAIGAAGFVVFSMMVSGNDSTTRVAAQVVSGVGFLGAGVILREGINVTGLNTAATLWCSAMVGTFAGAGQLAASGIAAGFVVLTNLFLPPLVRLIRALLLQAASAAGLGLRRLTSENLEDSPQVTVSALLVSADRNDGALEQIIGRISLEPFVTAVHWQAARAATES